MSRFRSLKSLFRASFLALVVGIAGALSLILLIHIYRNSWKRLLFDKTVILGVGLEVRKGSRPRSARLGARLKVRRLIIDFLWQTGDIIMVE